MMSKKIFELIDLVAKKLEKTDYHLEVFKLYFLGFLSITSCKK